MSELKNKTGAPFVEVLIEIGELCEKDAGEAQRFAEEDAEFLAASRLYLPRMRKALQYVLVALAHMPDDSASIPDWRITLEANMQRAMEPA